MPIGVWAIGERSRFRGVYALTAFFIESPLDSRNSIIEILLYKLIVLITR